LSTNTQLYSTATVKHLFTQMSATYGFINLISSVGFTVRWRRACVARAEIQAGNTVYDLMTGMGECLPHVVSKSGHAARINGVDFCPEMCTQARKTASRLNISDPQCILEEDVLDTTLEPDSADRIICSFGLKTLDPADLDRLAQQVFKLLRPGGRFSFVEISEPSNRFLRPLYLFYIRYVIPFIGFLFLGNPDNYRQLGIYTKHFKNCSHVRDTFEHAGLSTREYSLFFGCATGIDGQKPIQQGNE
jgi:ubiquinone/menaquinone biosynthesis C-methylase UbiE